MKEFEDALGNLKNEITSGAEICTVVVVLRTSKQVDILCMLCFGACRDRILLTGPRSQTDAGAKFNGNV